MSWSFHDVRAKPDFSPAPRIAYNCDTGGVMWNEKVVLAVKTRLHSHGQKQQMETAGWENAPLSGGGFVVAFSLSRSKRVRGNSGRLLNHLIRLN